MSKSVKTTNWMAINLGAFAAMAGVLAILFAVAPKKDGALDWFAPMIAGGWMAWTLPVALFFFVIACLLITFTLLAIRYPETPRMGVLRIETTRGDRLFISLLGSAFLNLGWIFFFGTPLWGALILCLVYAVAVFRWV
jgi:predicted small integral membrane protein